MLCGYFYSLLFITGVGIKDLLIFLIYDYYFFYILNSTQLLKIAIKNMYSSFLNQIIITYKILSNLIVNIYNSFLKKCSYYLFLYQKANTLPSGMVILNKTIIFFLILMGIVTLIFNSNKIYFLNINDYNVFKSLVILLVIIYICYSKLQLGIRLFNTIKSTYFFYKELRFNNNNIQNLNSIMFFYYFINIFLVVISVLFIYNITHNLYLINSDLGDCSYIYSNLVSVLSLLVYIDHIFYDKIGIDNNKPFNGFIAFIGIALLIGPFVYLYSFGSPFKLGNYFTIYCDSTEEKDKIFMELFKGKGKEIISTNNNNSVLINPKKGEPFTYIPLNREIKLDLSAQKINWNFDLLIEHFKPVDRSYDKVRVNINPLFNNTGFYLKFKDFIAIFIPGEGFNIKKGAWCSTFKDIDINLLKEDLLIKRVKNLDMDILENINVGLKNYIYNENNFIFKDQCFEYLSDTKAIIRISYNKPFEEFNEAVKEDLMYKIREFPYDPLVKGDPSTSKDLLVQLLYNEPEINIEKILIDKFSEENGFWTNSDNLRKLAEKGIIDFDQYDFLFNNLIDTAKNQYPINDLLIGDTNDYTEIIDKCNIILLNNIAELRILALFGGKEVEDISLEFNNLEEVYQKITQRISELKNQNIPQNLENTFKLLNRNSFLNNYSKALKNLDNAIEFLENNK